jgi:hypothetical protein
MSRLDIALAICAVVAVWRWLDYRREYRWQSEQFQQWLRHRMEVDRTDAAFRAEIAADLKQLSDAVRQLAVRVGVPQ